MSGTPALQVIRRSDASRQPWRNGGGWTREIHRQGGELDWDWRLSLAEVERDGPFSCFEGVQRDIVLVAGAGMHLHSAQWAHGLVPDAPWLTFAGEDAVACRLLEGPSTALNLMVARARVSARVFRRPLVGSSLLHAAAGEVWLLHQVAGELVFLDAPGRTTLTPGDTAIVRARGTAVRQRLDGGGSAVFIRLQALAGVQ